MTVNIFRMLREVNTHILIDLRITAHQHIIAMLLLYEAYDHLEEYLKSTNSYDSFEEDLSNLAARTLVAYNPSNIYNYKSISVLPSFMQKVAKYDNFEELYSTFPMKVSRPDGIVDYLRKDRRLCKQIYSIITKGNRDTHEHIMKCLRTELNHRLSSNSMGYMKRLSKWLPQREWENYEDVIDDNGLLKPTETYGTNLE